MHSFLSIDVGGTAIKYALLNNAGQITKKDKVPTPTSSLTEFMKSLYAIIDQYQAQISGLAAFLARLIRKSRWSFLAIRCRF